jgi:hypothetical protein
VSSLRRDQVRQTTRTASARRDTRTRTHPRRAKWCTRFRCSARTNGASPPSRLNRPPTFCLAPIACRWHRVSGPLAHKHILGLTHIEYRGKDHRRAAAVPKIPHGGGPA